MIGRNDSIGPVASPNRLAKLPSWKISVTTPNAPAIDSRLKTPAFTGIRIERNTIASSSSDSPTTTPMNSGSLSRIVLAKSMLLAVVPPIDTRAPVSLATGGSGTLRARPSRSAAGPLGSRRGRRVARRSDGFVGGLVLGRGRRVGDHRGRVAGLVDLRREPPG